jgi:hypothetical protein
MALGFPTNPSPGDTYTIGTTTYQWNGSAWIIVTSSVTASGITSTGTVVITGGTSATSTITGDLIVLGGVGIGGDLYIGGTLYAEGSPVLTTANFTATVVDGIDIDIVDIGNGVLEWNNISTLESVTTRGNSTTNAVFFFNTSQSTSTETGAVVISGGLGVGKRINAESVRIADAVLDSTKTLVNTTASTVIDTFDITEFRSAKYLIQIDEGTGAGADFECIEIILVADNNGNVWATEYGVVTSNGYLGEFEAEVDGNDVNLYFTAYEASDKTIKLLRTGIAA